MKKIYQIICLVIGFVLFLSYACRKELNSSMQDNISSDESWAKDYYRSLIKAQGRIVGNISSNKVSGSKVNLKHTIWKKAYYSETDKATFAEIPLLYNSRTALIKSITKITPKEEEEVFNATFDRLLIYKDKKTNKVNQKIITYIPDIQYLRKKGNDISHNQINRLDKDFTGYLEYKSWNGTRLYLLEVINGKTSRRIIFPQKKKNTKGNKVKFLYECGYDQVPIYGTEAFESDPETVGYNPIVASIVIGYESVPQMCDDGLTGDPCTDFGLCDDNVLTGDPCDDYGICEGENNPTPEPVPAGVQKDLLTNNCFKNVLNKYMAGPYGNAGSISSLGLILNLTFGLSNEWSLAFKDAAHIYNNNGQELEGSAQAIVDVNNPSKVIVEITLSTSILGSSSQEYIAATILHEIEHAYLTKLNPQSTEATQHEAMAADFMRNQMAAGLMAGFPGLSNAHANALSWGGLNEDSAGNPLTVNWTNYKSANPKNAAGIQGLNTDYRFATQGTGCQ